jgi:predicted nucleic acid-binding protein
VIAHTTFLSHLARERDRGQRGPAHNFLAGHRGARILTTVISAGELATLFVSNDEARRFFSAYRVLRLTPEIAYAASSIDRELILSGQRLGENDNWIAGFCRYYSQPIISLDAAFDRVPALRRLGY